MRYLKAKFKIIISVILYYFFCYPNITYAGLLNDETKRSVESRAGLLADEAGFDISETLGSTIARIIQAFLGLLGVIFIILIITAGHTWMTSGGNEEKITKAKETIRRAIIGLIIVIGAYSITWFVFKNLPGGAGGGGTPPGPPTGG